MTWSILNDKISILYYFSDENIDLEKVLELLNSLSHAYGLEQRSWKLPFTMQNSNSESWKYDYYKRIEFIVKRWFFIIKQDILNYLIFDFSVQDL